MSMNVNNMSGGGGGGDFGDPSLGQHYARMIGFVYIGVHERSAYKGTPKDPCGQALLTFELLDDFIEIDGVQRPRWVTKRLNTFNTQNAAIVKIYNTLDPEGKFGGDFSAMVKATIPAMVTIVQKTDANGNALDGTKIGTIATVAKAPDGTEYALGAAQNPHVLFDFDAPTLEDYAGLKNWMRKVVSEAQGYAGSEAEKVAKAYEVQATGGQAPAQQAPVQKPQPAPTAAQQTPPPPPPAPAQQETAPVQQTAPPAASAAPAGMPPPPPGYRYDQATNSYVPDHADQQPPPPAGGPAY